MRHEPSSWKNVSRPAGRRLAGRFGNGSTGPGSRGTGAVTGCRRLAGAHVTTGGMVTGSS
ncbi:hypothetical protein FRUB_03727 [Fimbriiglobus ruber]|uniref:Uncharacterized protein n=1 Tax=Fimbriiglobus ruber TaxID=1908690 RepID=A0A225DWT0_9BACT|nr:hypothetical protein FRUB_03727 [Fimbriiglobus ruber]